MVVSMLDLPPVGMASWPAQGGSASGSADPPPPTPPDQAWSPGNPPRADPYRNSGNTGRAAELGPPTGILGTPPAPPPSPAPTGPPNPVILRPEGIVND